MAQFRQLKFNDLAPDLELQAAGGTTVRLSSLWKDKVLLLAFTRHFGCPQCKEMLSQLNQIRPELMGKGLALAVITQGTAESAKAYCAQYAPGIMCLADPQRKAYQAYRIERANIWQTFLSWRVWQSNAALNKSKGWKTELPPEGQDAMQMGATFVIGNDGRIRLPYYYDDIADHPPVELMLRGVMGMDWGKPFESPITPDKA